MFKISLKYYYNYSLASLSLAGADIAISRASSFIS